MIVVPLKEGENIEKALKKFKRKFEKTGVVLSLIHIYRQPYPAPQTGEDNALEYFSYCKLPIVPKGGANLPVRPGSRKSDIDRSWVINE